LHRNGGGGKRGAAIVITFDLCHDVMFLNGDCETMAQI
jgi:hypothetical protein